MANKSQVEKLQSWLTDLWEQRKPNFFARLQVLEQASTALKADSLNSELQQKAASEARKLSSALTAYGFTKGAKLAARIETILMEEKLGQDKSLTLSHNVQALRVELERSTSATETAASSAAGAPVATAESRLAARGTIVYLDDDADIRAIAEAALRRQGFQVYTAEDGISGLELIKAQLPNLVLLDLMLPRMHGFAVLEEIRKDPLLHAIPVTVVSAKAYPLDIKKALEVGATGFLKKPFTSKDLLAKVQESFQSRAPRVEARAPEPLSSAPVAAALEDLPSPVEEPFSSAILVKFWGTRGSIATPGASTVRYGGNTSCVEVRYGNTVLLLDCGTGARELGMALSREFNGMPLHAHIFISHSHWDHIQGFPFFTPAYVSGNYLTVYSLRGADKSLEKVFKEQMDASYFPVEVSDMNSNLNFVELEGPVKVGGATISHIQLNHPGVAIAFRIDFQGKSLVYLTDHEPFWRLSGDNEYNRKLERTITEFAHDADLYIREAQYTEEEYLQKKGWGHSILVDALDSAQEARAKILAIYHHDPLHDDAAMDEILRCCQQTMRERGMTFKFLIATDYLELVL